MLNFFENFFKKLFVSTLFEQNILITIVLVILVGLNLLGIDIEYLSHSTYILVTLLVINILITIFIYPITSLKLKKINESMDKLDTFEEICESLTDHFNFMHNKIILIEKFIVEIDNCLLSLNEELKDLPNIKALKIVLQLKSKSLWNEIFKECLKYLLTFTDESANIINTDIKNSIDEIQHSYIDFIFQNIKIYDHDETLTEILNNKINNTKELILTELYKSKKIPEKLYIISLLLKSLDEDLNSEILTYLRKIQSNLL